MLITRVVKALCPAAASILSCGGVGHGVFCATTSCCPPLPIYDIATTDTPPEPVLGFLIVLLCSATALIFFRSAWRALTEETKRNPDDLFID